MIGAEGAAHEASRAGTVQARSRGTRSIVLAWAIAASIVVHAAILIATLPGGKPGIPKAAPPELRATLIPSESAPEPGPEIPVPVPPVLAAMPDTEGLADEILDEMTKIRSIIELVEKEFRYSLEHT